MPFSNGKKMAQNPWWRGAKRTQPEITCSQLTLGTLKQRCEISSKLTIKPPNSHLCSSVSINFEQVNARWEAVFTDISQAFDALITISQ